MRYTGHQSSGRGRLAAPSAAVVVEVALAAGAHRVDAQLLSPAGALRQRAATTGDLADVEVPYPTNFLNFVKDRGALKVLGKALFWDERVGSDRQSCGSCHFHAGADNRSRN